MNTETNHESIYFTYLNVDAYCKARYTIEKNLNISNHKEMSQDDIDVIVNVIMNSNGITALSTDRLLQKNPAILFAIHPRIFMRLVEIVTGEGIDPSEHDLTQKYLCRSDFERDIFDSCRDNAYKSYLLSNGQSV